MRYKPHIISLLIFQLVFFSLFLPHDRVYSAITAKVKVDVLNVRTGPGLTNTILTQVKKEETYTVLDEKNSWSKIKTTQGEGWVADWLIEKTQVVSKQQQESAQPTVPNLNVRSGPSTTFPTIEQIHNDKSYLVVDQEGDWLKIQLKPEKEGWVAKWLTKTSTTPPTEETTKKDKVKIIANSLNVRLGPSTSNAIIGSLVNGDEVEVFEIQNGWYRILLNKKEGWIAGQYASKLTDESEKQPEITNQPKVTILYPGTNIRSRATTLSEIVTVVNEGEQFTIIGTEGDWYIIELKDGQKAYVAGWIVSISGLDQTVKHGVEKALEGRTIVLDPGHGGYDSGSIGTYFKTKEKDVNLSVAKLLRKKLEASGAKVIMTRESDVKVSLGQRAYISNKNEIDAFISLHHNTIANPNVSGSITYYYKNQDKALANAVHPELIKENKIQDLNTRFGNFFVLRENSKLSILVELSFLTNYEDELLARSSSFQERSADGIFQGVVKYFQK